MPKFEFESFNDACKKIDDQIEQDKYLTAMKTCNAAISFFGYNDHEAKVFRTKMKIIKTLNKGELMDRDTAPKLR